MQRKALKEAKKVFKTLQGLIEKYKEFAK